MHNPASSFTPLTKHNRFQCANTTRYHSPSADIVLFAKAFTFHERHTRTSRPTAPSDVTSETADRHASLTPSRRSNSRRPDHQARPSDIFDYELSLETPRHIISQQKQVKPSMNDNVDSPAPSKNDAAAIIKANFRLLFDPERAPSREVSRQHNKFKRRADNTNQSIQYLSLPGGSRQNWTPSSFFHKGKASGENTITPIASLTRLDVSSDVDLPSLWQPGDELRSAAMSNPQGFPTRTMATKAYKDSKTRLGDTPVKRPKNSNLFVSGRFLPEMRRPHSPGQEMDAPAFAEDFISLYEDAQLISAILTTLNTRLTHEVMKIIINAFPANAENQPPCQGCEPSLVSGRRQPEGLYHAARFRQAPCITGSISDEKENSFKCTFSAVLVKAHDLTLARMPLNTKGLDKDLWTGVHSRFTSSQWQEEIGHEVLQSDERAQMFQCDAAVNVMTVNGGT
ncbi:hypothetical protein FAVG1_08485 [Fusarium avenaceum]|nr:hypothetical protein FAVG1_08485 [Fusarium avenaceum]